MSLLDEIPLGDAVVARLLRYAILRMCGLTLELG